MSWFRIWAISLRIIRQFKRDHRTLALIFIVPIVLLSLLGVLINSTTTIRLGVNDHDTGITIPSAPGKPPVTLKFSKPFITSLEDDSDIDVKYLSKDKINQKIKDGKLDGTIEIGTNFSKELQKHQHPQIKVTVEGSDPSINNDIILQVRQRLPLFAPAQMPKISIDYYYGSSSLETLDYYAPVFIAFFVFFIVFLLTSVSFLRERGQGTIERLMVSPVSRLEITIGYLLGFLVFAVMQSIVILLFTVYVLKAKFFGQLWEIFVIELLLTIGSVNLGIFLSSFARTELQVVQFIPIVITPQVLLSGMIWPVRTIPYYLRWLATIMPLTYANNALRAMMIRGLPISDVKPEIAFLITFALVLMVFSMLTIRKNII
jgi:ABC-2 type transport system permease protein